MRHANHRHQQGAVIVTVSLLMLFLLGFVAFALDFGKLFVVKTELQTAMDSCALAAARELDGQSTALTRATSAGLTAGNLNRVNFQSSTWSGEGQLVAEDITFKDSDYASPTSAALAKYAQCQHVQPRVQLWLMQAMGAFSGNTALYTNSQNVMATAVAVRASAQSTCPIPIALIPKPGGTAANNYLMEIGDWVKVVGDKSPGSGEFGWYDLDGSKSAKEAKDEFEDPQCGSVVGDQLGTPGAKTSLDVLWNYRFGIYKQGGDPAVHHPDFSGYAYTDTNWKVFLSPEGAFKRADGTPPDAYKGSKPSGSDTSAANFETKRASFASFDDTGTDLAHGSQIVFGNSKILNSFRSPVASPGIDGQHQRYGADRRIVTVPVINNDSARSVIDFVCVFMLHPLTGPQAAAYIEYRGPASLPNSPCTTAGLPGGTAGPLVPTLVR